MNNPSHEVSHPLAGDPTPAAPQGMFPTVAEVRLLEEEVRRLRGDSDGQDLMQLVPGSLALSDGLHAMSAELFAGLDQQWEAAPAGSEDRRNIHALKSRTMSVSDLDPDGQLYGHFANNPNSIANWLPSMCRAVDDAGPGAGFHIPETRVVRLPPELAQFIRLEYSVTTEASRAAFNKVVQRLFDLPDEGTYFIKTGTFSCKFEFANCKCSEPDEMGEYFQVINNSAMALGAGDSIDLCVREYITDPGDSAEESIYHGMPLRCEARAFVDFDHPDGPRLLGVTPYWHPTVMNTAMAVSQTLPIPSLRGDLGRWKRAWPRLRRQYDQHLGPISDNLRGLLPHLAQHGWSGQWSIDVMVADGKYWLIDAALMGSSALVDVLRNVEEQHAFVTPAEIDALMTEEKTQVLNYQAPASPFPVGGVFDTRSPGVLGSAYKALAGPAG